MEIRFCYEIAADAGLANDEVGNPSEAYVQVTFKAANKVLEKYDLAHQEIGAGLAQEYGWDPSWVKPISTAEYDENQIEDDQPMSCPCGCGMDPCLES